MRIAAPLVALAGLCMVPAPAQQAPPTRQTPVFRSGVDLVRLDVSVTDRSGRPVTDLRATELTVVEDGIEKPVLLFQRVQEPSEPYLEVARRTAGGEVSTNQGAARGHLYVLVFDQQHITAGNEQRARLAAERFVRARVRPGDRVALYGLPGPGPQVDFTADVTRVLSQLTGVRGTLERTAQTAMGVMSTYEAFQIARGNQFLLTRVVTRMRQEAAGTDIPALAARVLGRSVEGGDPSLMNRLVTETARSLVQKTDAETRLLLSALSDLIATLHPIEGRKDVLLFSEGFYADTVTHELERVDAAAARSYSVIHSFDLNRRDLDPAASEPSGGDRYTEIQDRLSPLGSLAAETNGTLIVDAQAQLDAALARLAAAARDYYIVGFEPARGASADRERYRRVKVAVKRSGARVSARTGYSMAPAPTPADRRRSIDAALRAPFAQQGLPIEYTTYLLRGPSGETARVVLALAVDLPVAAGVETRAADLVFAVRDAKDGRVLTSGSDTIALPAASDPGATTGRTHYRVQFELAPGEYLMRTIVREPGGLVGSADRRFVVRALGGPGVTASDLVVAGSESGGIPVRAVVHANEMLTGFVEVYARTPEQLNDLRVDLSLARLDGPRASRSTAAVAGAVKTDASGALRVAELQLPVQGLAPGHYLAHALVRSGTDTVAELDRQVELRAGSAPKVVAARRPVARVVDPLQVLNGHLTQQYVRGLAGGNDARVARAAQNVIDTAKWADVEQVLGAAGTSQTPGESALRGLARFAARDYASAAEALGTSFQLDGRKNPLTAFLLGWAHALAGNDSEAITAWRGAIFLDPKLVPAYLALADTYVRLSQLDLARQVLRAGLAVMPQSPELQNRLIELDRQ